MRNLEIRSASLRLPAQADAASGNPRSTHSRSRSRDDIELTARKHVLNHRLTGLQQALQREAHRRWRYDRTVKQDWAQSESYARQRRAELAALPGGAQIAAQYGLTFAKKEFPADTVVRELLLTHEVEVDYLRGGMPAGEFLDQCQALYRNSLPESSCPAVFVNSRHSAEIILHHLRDLLSDTDTKAYLQRHPQKLRPGVYALPLDEYLAEKAEPLIHIYGARPSVYSVMAGSNTSIELARPDPTIDNRKLLAAFRPEQGEAVADRLHAIPDSQGVAGLGHTAATLLDQLSGLLEGESMEPHRHNPVLANGLRALHAIADCLPDLSHDNLAFCNGYQTLIEELNVCLSAVRPYDLRDFRQAAAPLAAAHQLPPSMPAMEVYLVSSGMGALSLGFEVAEIMTGNANVEEVATGRHGKTPVYYEVAALRELLRQTGAKRTDTLYATLGHSLPDKPGRPVWNVDAVIDAIDGRLSGREGKHGLKGAFKALQQQFGYAGKSGPLVLILDATLERRGDMDRLVGRFAKDIAAGNLRIIACKSYQKYPNLCSGKVMAGGVALISADDAAARKSREHLARVEEDLGWIDNSEMQLMTHMLKGREHEFELLEHAIGNANFVAEHFFHGRHGHTQFELHDGQLPFAAIRIPAKRGRFTLHLADREQIFRPDYKFHLNLHLLRPRDSFGFPATTLVFMISGGEELLRISFGQESRAELTERFYMLSRMLRDDVKWSCAQAFTHILQLIDEGLRDAGIPSHAPLTLAQKLNAIGRAEWPVLDNEARLRADPAVLSQQRRPDPNGKMTLNRIASVMIHLGTLINLLTEPSKWQSGRDRDLLHDLLRPLIQSGLPGVSRTGRAAILDLQAFLCEGDMHSVDVEQRVRGLRTLAESCQRMPGALRSGEYLRSIPDEVFAAAPRALREQTLEALFETQDSQTCQQLIQSMLEDCQFSKAAACLDRFERLLDRTPPLVAESLHSARREQPSDLPEPMHPRQSNDLCEHLLRQRLALADSH